MSWLSSTIGYRSNSWVELRVLFVIVYEYRTWHVKSCYIYLLLKLSMCIVRTKVASDSHSCKTSNCRLTLWMWVCQCGWRCVEQSAVWWLLMVETTRVRHQNVSAGTMTRSVQPASSSCTLAVAATTTALRPSSTAELPVSVFTTRCREASVTKCFLLDNNLFSVSIISHYFMTDLELLCLECYIHQ